MVGCETDEQVLHGRVHAVANRILLLASIRYPELEKD